jgi:hypothetical protein
MSNDLIFKDTKAPTLIQGERRLTKLGQALAANSMTRRIQTNTNGTFKKIVNGEQIGSAVRGEMNVIIVGALSKVSRVYYREKFDPNKEATMPNCWSNLGDTPEEDATDKQHSNCADCPMNIKGSGDTGGKACRYQRRISVLMEHDNTGDVYQFNIPSKSLFGKGTGNVHPFESYIKYLIANGISPDSVVTNVQYDLDADSMELQFSPVRVISDEEFAQVIKAQDKPETERYTKITVAQADNVTRPPATKTEASKPAPTPAPAPAPAPKPKVARSEEPDDEPEIATPTKRVSSKKPEEAPRSVDDLANVVADWTKEEDDE